jgi:hypothetical protein
MRATIILLTLLLVACGPSEPATDFLREVTTAAREKSRVQMLVRATAEEPTDKDLALRKSIEDRIEQDRIGRLVSAGAGAGFIDVIVEVDNTSAGIAQLRRVAQDAGVSDRVSFKVVADQD